MKRSFRARAFLLVALWFVLAPTLSGASTLTQAKLTKELLTLAQMPAGWSTGNAAGDDGIGCIKGLLEPKGVTQTHSAQAYYLGTVNELPRFDEKIATYSNVKSAYTKIIATIDACHSLAGPFNGVEVTGSVEPISFTHYGTASSAFAMTLSDVRGTLHYDYLIVRKKNVIAAFLEGSYPSVNTSEYQSLVILGLKKLS
jgi:hypothetical protein